MRSHHGEPHPGYSVTLLFLAPRRLLISIIKCDEPLFKPIHTPEEPLEAWVLEFGLDLNLSSTAHCVGLGESPNFPRPQFVSL